MPFGNIAHDGKLIFPKRSAALVILGFEELSAHTENKRFEDQVIPVSPLAGIVLLKLLAYIDRPEARQKDLDDILLIITCYFEAENELIYDRYTNDLIAYYEANESTIYSEYEIGATAINKEIRRYLGEDNSPTKTHLKLYTNLINTTANYWQKKLNHLDDDNPLAYKLIERLMEGLV